MKLKLFVVAGFLSIGALKAQDFVKGVVYNDLNKNGKRDKSEVGIANVSVSNGVQVVQTNAKGEYQLPIKDDQIIFVVKPRDYALPLNEKKLPQFYYAHKPTGSPKLTYKAYDPTGKLPKQVNFALYEQAEPSEFKAYVFGDPQAYSVEEINYFKRGILDDLKDKNQVKFGISLGDLVGNHLELHKDYISVMSEVGLPWFNVIGNHDLNFDVQADSLSDETFEFNFGPANYAFNYGNAHFLILDNIIYPNPNTGKGYIGGFRKDQLDFIENNLKLVPKDKLIVLAFHIPIHNGPNAFRTEDRLRLFDILANFPNTVSLSAHTHYQKQNFLGAKEGWKQEKPHHEFNVGTTSGDWYSGSYNHQNVPNATMRDGTPKGYAILNVNHNSYSFDYKVAGESADYQIKLIAPGSVQAKHVHRFSLVANFFMGAADNLVEYKIGNGKWKKMNYTPGIDPKYAFDLLSFDNAESLIEARRPSDPVQSTHLWSVKLPKLEAGKHKLEVRATDMFGKVHYAEKSITVVK